MSPRKRWDCPNGCPGVLAPGRMRKDDVRRFCLPCSAESGRLVERVAPALERKRAEAKEKRREKVAADRARARERFLLSDGTDVVRLVWRARRLKAWGRESSHGAGRVKRARVDIVIGQPRGSHGRAWSGRVHLHLMKDEHPALAMALILHELAHIAAGGEHGHDRYFWTLWLDAMQEVYPGLREREAELWRNRDAWVAKSRGSGFNHYALEFANRSVIIEEHSKGEEA